MLFAVILIAALSIARFNNPPNGRTGAPGDGNCTDCHSQGNPNGYGGSLTISGLPGSIDPNTVYNITVTTDVTAGSPHRTGFQLVALNSSNSNSGTLANGDSDVAFQSSGGRTYAEHSPGHLFLGGTTKSWNFEWTSPAGPGGDVITFYANTILGSTPDGQSTGNSDDFMIHAETFGTMAMGADPLEISIISFTDVSCFGGSDGEAVAEATGGTTPYDFLWSSGGSTETETGLSAGIYDVTVTDADLNTATTSVTISEPLELTLSIVEVLDVDCFWQ